MSSFEKLAASKSFGGSQNRYSHLSEILNCEMNFSIYIPPTRKGEKLPALYWLSGLTCNDENFITKAGAQKYAAKNKIILVCPDTSPRGESVPDDEQSAYDFGHGAGFYVNATKLPWKTNYQMYDYVLEELPRLIESICPIDSSRISISGHSMGGHGALVLGLRNPSVYSSISAFSPICAPSQCPWGQKALSLYLGGDPRSSEDWSRYDASELMKDIKTCLPVLIDQGSSDQFLSEQLNTETLIKISKNNNLPVNIRYQEGYDHSYFFISSFIEEHINFHSKFLS